MAGMRRRIGAVGTAARVLLGSYMVISVIHGQSSGRFSALSWLVGLMVLPALLVGWQWARSRRTVQPLDATGPVGHVLTVAAFVALWLTPQYAPPVWFLSDAAVLFFGSSMLVAALRGYGGCEVLAVSNWLLRRDDQVGCLVFAPIDHLENRTGRNDRARPLS